VLPYGRWRTKAFALYLSVVILSALIPGGARASEQSEPPDLNLVFQDLQDQGSMGNNIRMTFTVTGRQHPNCPGMPTESALTPIKPEDLRLSDERTITLYVSNERRRIDTLRAIYLTGNPVERSFAWLETPIRSTTAVVFDGSKTYYLEGGWDADKGDVSIISGNKTGLEGIYTPLSLMSPRNDLPIVEAVQSFPVLEWLAIEEKVLDRPCNVLECRNEGENVVAKLWITQERPHVILRRVSDAGGGSGRFISEAEGVEVLENGYVVYTSIKLSHLRKKVDQLILFSEHIYRLKPEDVALTELNDSLFQPSLGRPGLYHDADVGLTWLVEPEDK